LITSIHDAPQWSYNWSTVHSGNVRVQVRLPGERFWTEWGSSDMDLNLFNETAVEVVATSWEYPALYLGRVEQRAVFDLVGMTWAKEQLSQYAAEIDQATAPIAAPIIPAPTCPPTAPRKLRAFNIERAYPQRAIDQGIEADVTGEVLVAEDGTVSDVQVQRTEQNNIFVDGFIREARRVAFSPATSGCKPIIANYRLSVSFKLGE
jgi:TonB family protein